MTDNQTEARLLTRREAIIRVSAMLGGVALVGQAAMLAPRPAQAQSNVGDLFTDADIELLDEIAETILPETDTPGAKAAGVGPFIAMMVADVYYDDDQRIFRDGLVSVEEDCEQMHGGSFMQVTDAQRLALVEKLDREQHARSQEDGAPTHYFRMMKELTLLGYFTSEIGCTVAQRYVESPGRFDPCAPYSPGDTAWTDHA